jgi:glucosamine--fructose-6-phosphate aminotransferase (isomerizing)
MMPTHMARETGQIAEVIRRLLRLAGPELAEAGAAIRACDPLFLTTVARGSSDHAAAFLKTAIELTAGRPVASLGPSIASIYHAGLKLDRSVSIAISQSGKSPDIVSMARATREGGALTVALTNTAGSPLARCVHHPIDIRAGEELSVAATKTFVSSAVAGLALLGHWTGDGDLLGALEALPGHVEAAIRCDWMTMAEALDEHRSLFIIGRGPGLAMAYEAALKFKETCAMHAEAFSAAEVMHGPVALVANGFPVLALAVPDEAEASVAEAAEALTASGARVFTTAAAGSGARILPAVRTGHRLTDPLALIVSFYCFIEGFARLRGLDPDRPRHLRKVTETL